MKVAAYTILLAAFLVLAPVKLAAAPWRRARFTAALAAYGAAHRPGLDFGREAGSLGP